MYSTWLPQLMQLVRFAAVGLLNNMLGYLIYLAVTWLGLEPKLAVTLLYPIGALTGYLGHAKFAFGYEGSHLPGLARYTAAHLLGYGLNVLLLHIFTDRLGIAHQIVQFAAIFVVASVLFVLYRFWVFPRGTAPRGNAA